MPMIELIAWLIGIVVAIWGGIGLSLFLQGRYLVAVEQEKEDKKLRRDRAKHIESVGIAFFCLGFILLIVIITLIIYINCLQ